MKKVYYLSKNKINGTINTLLNLVKEDENKLIFNISAFDWDRKKVRTITLKAIRMNDGRIELKSSKEQFKYHYIKEIEIEDNKEPENFFIN